MYFWPVYEVAVLVLLHPPTMALQHEDRKMGTTSIEEYKYLLRLLSVHLFLYHHQLNQLSNKTTTTTIHTLPYLTLL